MFYAQFVLSKKGPLAKIWLAAHWEKKLSRAQIYETNVDEAVEEIMEPKQKIALRTTGHLLLGIVKIYSRKTKYLLADCNEAFLKIKLAFRPGQLDKPNEPTLSSFTMPDVFGDFDMTLPDFNDADYITASTTRLDEITLKEDHMTNLNSNRFTDFENDDFGEMEAGIDYSNYNEDLTMEYLRDGFDLNSILGNDNGSTREPTPCLENAHAPGKTVFTDEDIGDYEGNDDFDDAMSMNSGVLPCNREMNAKQLEEAEARRLSRQIDTPIEYRDDSESLDMMQLDMNVDPYYERQERRKKKRKLMVDEYKNLSSEEMKNNMNNYRDTLNALDLSPPTRKLMKLKAYGTVEKLFHLPGTISLKAKPLVKQYQSKLIINRHDMTVPKNDRIRRELGLTDVVDDIENHMELNAQENPFPDEFDDADTIDFENYDTSSPVQIELSSEVLPNSPVPDETSDDFASPTDKKKSRREGRQEEEEENEDDNRFSKRTQALLTSISNKIKSAEDEQIILDDLLTKGATRKTAAQKFYTLLVLKKWQAIDVHQEAPYDDIYITAGPNIGQTLQ
ncbi:unnamed protein product [Caenorhabditis bovis]|uniref:Uncharacterized protein n=1 Tax=Caenorhabditis bovis TaxID=2654633 RepID=A0A8S1EPP5_9PELO|nr:unnamed protein product [Caenorhabditis bovis]